MFLVLAVATHARPAAGDPPPYCWRALPSAPAEQNLGLMTLSPSFASRNVDEAWLALNEDQPQVVRWDGGAWHNLPPLVTRGGERGRYPVLAVSPSGRTYVMTSTNGDEGTSALNVARENGGRWEWLGGPLLSSREPYTHAEDAAITFTGPDEPVVVWSEERHVVLAGFFAARWDGAAWQRLGELHPRGTEYSLSPSLAADSEGRIWLAWNDSSGLRVARWDGTQLDRNRSRLTPNTRWRSRLCPIVAELSGRRRARPRVAVVGRLKESRPLAGARPLGQNALDCGRTNRG